MKTITVPAYEQVSPANQAIFDNLKKGLGFVPNLYATFAHSDTALGTYLALQNAKSSLSPKAREVINLVVSQVNSCAYCLAAHTALGRNAGATAARSRIWSGRRQPRRRADGRGRQDGQQLPAWRHADCRGLSPCARSECLKPPTSQGVLP